jgi:4-carboxymuconolactone decarboxylase
MSMRASGVRVAALPPEDFSDEQKELVGDWSTLNFSRVLVQHPSAYRVFLPYIDKTIRGSNLPPREREILITRTLALSGDVYEAHHHVAIALKSGMTQAEIDSVRAGRTADFAEFERNLVQAADELMRQHQISDQTWRNLAERYSQQQLMEIVLLVGCYSVMAMMTLSFGIELEKAQEVDQRLAQLRQYT